MIEEALIKELTQVPTTKSSGTKANMSNQMQQIAASQPTGRWTSGTNLQHDEKIRQKGNVGGGSRNIQKKQQNRYTRNRRELSFSKSTKKIEASFSGESERKQGGECLNSLLNFHYSSSTDVKSSFYKTSHSIQSHKRKRTNTFNKEVFLQANCHFVVDDHIEYPESIADPDVLVDWQLIRLVYLPMHEPTNCPICLSPPWAAKITRCGHLYCWSCILHYLQLDNKSWRKCPICHEAVHQKDLKSVCTIQRKRFARHDNITMKLMKKEKGSLFTSPACSKQSNTTLPQWRGDSLLQFKLMLADQDLVINQILLREKNELEVQLQEALADNTGEACFIESAMLEIEKQIGELKNIDSDLKQALRAGKDIEQTNIKEEKYDATSVAAMLSHTNIGKRVEFSDDDLKPAAMLASPPAELCGQMDGKDSPEEDQDFRPDKGIEDIQFERENMNKTVDAVDNSDLFYYYYQAEDGQNIFIDSLNARCLIEEYGALCFGPEMITGQILDFESYTMTKELRKRFRYLSHLPLSCEFVICELLLRPPALSKHTIHNFMPEFRKRRATRARKTEEQRRFDRKAQNIINKDLGFRVTEYDSNEEQIDLTDMTDFPASFSPPNNTSTAENEQQSSSGRSFAQMLKEKQAEAFPPMPVATPKKQSNTSWGPTVLNKSTLAEMKLQAKNADQNDDEEMVAAPSFKSTFNAALFPMASVTNEVTSPPNNKQNRKKNKKGTVLFSTGAAQRRY